MVSKNSRNLLVIAIIIFLSACRTDFDIDIFSSDIFLDTNVDTPVQMLIEIPSCSKSTEYEAEVLALFSSTSKAKIAGCEEQGMKSMLVISTVAEIATENGDRDILLFREIIVGDQELVVGDGKFYEIRGIKPFLNPAFLERVNTLMKKKFQTLSYKDISIQFAVNNDDRGDILISGTQVWVDGKPYYKYLRKALTRRQKISIKLSDVMSDLIMRGAYPIAFYVFRPK